MVFGRISGPRVISVLLFVTFALIFWKIFNHASHAKFQNTCNMTDDYQRNLEELLHRVSSQLEKHNFIVFLCYGSLWGEIRMSRLLPWSHKAELCILEDHLTEYGRNEFVKDFEQSNFNVRYIAADGYYHIENDSNGWAPVTTSKPYVEIYLFAKDQNQNIYRRTGWRRRLLPSKCEWSPSLQCFPTSLIDDSLPRNRLGRYSYPVPKGHIELQKHLYPTNWWMEIKPKNC